MGDVQAIYANYRKWLVFAAASLAFFFLNASTFAALGVVLYTMVGDLHWSNTAAGLSFSLLGIACGVSSMAPTLIMKRLGGRATMAIGGLTLFAGFQLASVSHSLLVFDAAMVAVGIGFSLAGNVPGVWLVATWFPQRAARMIGFYLAIGAMGNTIGPPLVETVVAHGGWRTLWRVLAMIAFAVGVLCLVVIREAHKTETASPVEPLPVSGWRPRQAMLTSQFLLVLIAMIATITGVTTISSTAVTHLVKLGASPTAASLVLGACALVATLTKGVAGRLCEHVASSLLLAMGLVAQAAGIGLLGFADSGLLQYGAATLFGLGWGLAFVAGTVVLIEYFGRVVGPEILSVVWMGTTLAAAGPVAAGLVADRYGSFSPIFYLFAFALLLIAAPIFAMRAPAVVGRAMPALRWLESPANS